MNDKMKNLLDELVNGNSTLMLGFVLTDMFCIMFMFLVYELPIGIVIGLCSCAGAIISGIIMTKATSVPGKDGQESLAEKLSYFPVKKQVIKAAQYRLAFKITGIQLLATLAPLVFMCFRFKWEHALAALVSTAVSMLVTAAFFIEINQISYKQK